LGNGSQSKIAAILNSCNQDIKFIGFFCCFAILSSYIIDFL
jgi:hypothetical protein